MVNVLHIPEKHIKFCKEKTKSTAENIDLDNNQWE